MAKIDQLSLLVEKIWDAYVTPLDIDSRVGQWKKRIMKIWSRAAKFCSIIVQNCGWEFFLQFQNTQKQMKNEAKPSFFKEISRCCLVGGQLYVIIWGS